MKGLLKMSKLADKMPFVYEWLKQAEATRRLIIDNYSHVPEDDLLQITVAENVLTQLENLSTYPVIRSRLHQGRLSLHGWIYSIESGDILTYDPVVHDFVNLESRTSDSEYVYNLHPSCSVSKSIGCKIYGMMEEGTVTPTEKTTIPNVTNTNLPRSNRLSKEQAERIYRGSAS